MADVTPYPEPAVHRFQPEPQRVEGLSRYTHILVPTRLDGRDRGAILHALELGAAHGAVVTILHVQPPDAPSNSLHWLDAIDRLHQSISRMSRRTALGANGSAKSELELYVELMAPAALRERARVELVRVVGDLATETARFAEPVDVDLVVLSLEPWGWGLPILPGHVRTIFQRIRKQVVLVSPDNSPVEAPVPSAIAALA